MTYANDDFWKAYEEFVVESLPRHRIAAGGLPYYKKLADLGCGQSAEAIRLLKPDEYLGIDLSPPTDDKFVKLDYRDEKLVDILKEYQPDCFSSLFSAEITKPFTENYELYNKLFREVPSLQSGIVSGFYYENRKGQLTVEEAGGLVSYQSIEAPRLVESNLFAERRLYLEAPSKLFGPDVVEVWKIFTRKQREY